MKNFETLRVGDTYLDSKGYEVEITSGFQEQGEPEHYTNGDDDWWYGDGTPLEDSKYASQLIEKLS